MSRHWSERQWRTIIERYQRRESSVEEALWVTRVSPSTVSNLNKKIYAKIEAWRHKPIDGAHPYVFLDGIVMNGPGRAKCATSRCRWQ